MRRLARSILMVVTLAGGLVLLAEPAARSSLVVLALAVGAAVAWWALVGRRRVRVAAGRGGVAIARRDVVRTIPYGDISAIDQERSDVCVRLASGGVLRLGMGGALFSSASSVAACVSAVRMLRAAWVSELSARHRTS